MKNKTFLSSIKCAANGLIYAIRTEKNYMYYFIIAGIFLAVNLASQVTATGHLVYVVATLGVFSTECLNTAIEHLADMVQPDMRRKVKVIKDMAAGAVLCWGFVFFINEIIMLGCAWL